MEPVEAHLDHHEEVPRLGLDEPTGHLEATLGHLEDLVHHEVRALLAEVRDVEDVLILAQLLLDLGLELGGERVAFGARRREEARHPPAGELLGRREAGRHPDQERPLSRGAEHVPDRRLLHGQARRDLQTVVARVLSVAEAVDAQLARSLAGHRAGPCRHGDRRRDAGQLADHAVGEDLPQVRHLIGEVLEQELRCAAVQADDRDPGSILHALHLRYSSARCMLLPLGCRDGRRSRADVPSRRAGARGGSAVRVSYQPAEPRPTCGGPMTGRRT